MAVKMNLRIITESNAADSEIVSCKIDFKVQWLSNSHADSVKVKYWFSSVTFCPAD